MNQPNLRTVIRQNPSARDFARAKAQFNQLFEVLFTADVMSHLDNSFEQEFENILTWDNQCKQVDFITNEEAMKIQ
jgi:hypothetical protein